MSNKLNSTEINVILKPHLYPATQSLIPFPLKPQIYTSPKNLHKHKSKLNIKICFLEKKQQ